MNFSLLIFPLLFIIPTIKATTFNYPIFDSLTQNIILEGNASISGGLQLTTNRVDVSLKSGNGRAVYGEPVRLWDKNTGQLADFTTQFSFKIIQAQGDAFAADGLTFFLAANASIIPRSSGSMLGLYRYSERFNSSTNPAIAVEFDTFQNEWDPPSDHVGVDINSIKSVAIWNVTLLKNGSIAYVWVSYNSSTKNLSVYMTYDGNFAFNRQSILSYIVDMRSILPEWVHVGFSASTGYYREINTIISWQFNSTEFPAKEKNTRSVFGLVSVCILLVVMLLVLFLCWLKRGKEEDITWDDDYESGTVAKRFYYRELARATNNFTAEGKLGEGGFGDVYQGILNDLNIKVAIKRISPKSKQGEKEFSSEVKIISQLRHRNLVKLLGWCHEQEKLLLVYEFMLNGSLDFHLFGGRSLITWMVRYKIAIGLASAILYLHEGWEQAVVHRDIKPSNIMLDSSFNPKLGDFGLARFIDHDLRAKTTTMIAGTMGYLDPKCIITGKIGKESDVYSFGVVSLELACGRKVVEPNEEDSKIGLVAWVWELYENGNLLEAVDSKLGMDFDELQMTRLMVVGLWCASMDHNLRPSIKQAISVLNFESPLPDLPFKMSMTTHLTPFHGLIFSPLSSGGTTNTNGTQNKEDKSITSSHIIMLAKVKNSAHIDYSKPLFSTIDD